MTSPLFKPWSLGSFKLKNRIVMAPMTRSFADGGVPSDEMKAYYQRRAEGEVGLIITEGTVVDRPASTVMPKIPHFYGEKALQGWKGVVEGVKASGGMIAPQIWHQGIVKGSGSWAPGIEPEGPSGLIAPGVASGKTMTVEDIEDTITAFIEAGSMAKELGFDALELHGAHGYLIDQFFWHPLNQRTDIYGGNTIEQRTRFAVDIIKGIRAKVGEDFPIILRISQWKQQDYQAKIALTPIELESWVAPIADAGVDIFHCSQRRIAEPEFTDSPLNFAGWVKKLTGKPTISVGSVGLAGGDFLGAFRGSGAAASGLDWVEGALDRGEFDLVAVGRALLADPEWVMKIKTHRHTDLIGFQKEHLKVLY